MEGLPFLFGVWNEYIWSISEVYLEYIWSISGVYLKCIWSVCEAVNESVDSEQSSRKAAPAADVKSAL
jgi:hypothetical protein